MSQTKDDIEEFYKTPDPWGYETHPDDSTRAWYVYSSVVRYGPFKRVLDIGAGEGFITKAFRSKSESIEAVEISDEAAKRFPSFIKRVKQPRGTYDLIIATGVLYEQYDNDIMREWIEEHAAGLVLTSHYDGVGQALDIFEKPQIFYAEFPYRSGKQILRVYQWTK